jgi:hypothetical protein
MKFMAGLTLLSLRFAAAHEERLTKGLLRNLLRFVHTAVMSRNIMLVSIYRLGNLAT